MSLPNPRTYPVAQQFRLRLSRSVVSAPLRPHGLHPARLLCPWGVLQARILSGLPCIPPGGLPNPRIKPRPPTLQADSLLSEPPGKPLLNVHIYQITIYTLKMLQFYLSYLNKAEKINK